MHYGQFELFDLIYEDIIYTMADISEELHTESLTKEEAEKL
jgi:hypothetical protein